MGHLKNILGFLVGILEFLGLRYPVKHYMARVSDALWRGSRLQPADYVYLKSKGFKTVLSLCAENNKDKEPCASAGLLSFRIPIVDNTAPTVAQATSFLSLVGMNAPLYVHCEAGKGRTGTMVAIYRIKAQGWSVDDAIAEAKRFGLELECQERFIRQYCRDYVRRHRKTI